MADITVTTGLVLPTKYHDNNADGSWAPVVSTAVPRATEILHRSAIATADVLATPGVPTAADVVETSASLAASPMHFAVAAGNRWGPTTATVDGGAVTPTVNHALKVVVAQIAGADYYDIFLSTAVAPLWVGRITEAQRATGDQAIVTVGTVTTRSSATVAGTIVVGIVGTGLAQTAAPFNNNFALTPAAITPINCVGYNSLYYMIKVTVTDLRALPVFTHRPMLRGGLSTNDWFGLGATTNAQLSSITATTLEFAQTIAVAGASAVVIVFNGLSAQISAIDVWVSLF